MIHLFLGLPDLLFRGMDPRIRIRIRIRIRTKMSRIRNTATHPVISRDVVRRSCFKDPLA
jgi:hypothetical protein